MTTAAGTGVIQAMLACVTLLMAASILTPFGPALCGEDEPEGASEGDMTSILAVLLWA